jgi:hypothetical protein
VIRAIRQCALRPPDPRRQHQKKRGWSLENAATFVGGLEDYRVGWRLELSLKALLDNSKKAPHDGHPATTLFMASNQPARLDDATVGAVYDELRRLARGLQRKRGHVTLSATVLVHEAFIKLSQAMLKLARAHLAQSMLRTAEPVPQAGASR